LEVFQSVNIDYPLMIVSHLLKSLDV